MAKQIISDEATIEMDGVEVRYVATQIYNTVNGKGPVRFAVFYGAALVDSSSLSPQLQLTAGWAYHALTRWLLNEDHRIEQVKGLEQIAL